MHTDKLRQLRILIREFLIEAPKSKRKIKDDKEVKETSLSEKPWWPVVQMIRNLNPQDRKAILNPERGNYVVVHRDEESKRDPLSSPIARDVLADIANALAEYGDDESGLDLAYKSIDRTWGTLRKDLYGDLIKNTLSTMLKKDEEKSKFSGKISAKDAEAPKDAPLGQIAFGEERVDDVPPEPDTKFEKKMLQSLDRYIGNHLKMKFSSNELAAVQDILASGMYKKIFRSPGGNVYRGMSLSSNQFEEQFPELAEEVYADLKKPYKKDHKIKGVYTSSRGDQISSWSSDESVAETFARDSEFRIKGEGEELPPVNVIYTAKASDNGGRLFDLSNLYSLVKTANSSLRSNEAESLGFGPIMYSSVRVERKSKTERKGSAKDAMIAWAAKKKKNVTAGT